MLKLHCQKYWIPLRVFVLLNHCILTVLFAFVVGSNSSLQAQCTPVCISSLSVSLGGNGEAEITVEMVLTNAACNPADFTLEITNSSGTIVSDTLNCSQIGETLDYSITHMVSGNSCGGTLQVSDYFSPTIHCQDTTIWCIQSADPSDIGYPIVTDNCSTLGNNDLSYTDDFMDLACFTAFNGDSVTSKIERTWTVSDENGNTATCVQNIYFKRATLDDLLLPLNRDDIESPALDCLDDPMDLNLTGAPSLAGILLDNSTHCELLISSSDQVLPDCSPNSVNILRTWTLLDECNGGFIVDVQLIKLKDKTAPVVNCPTDITVGTQSSTCNAIINLPNTATATDDCSAVMITPSWSFGTGYGPFSDIPIGTYVVDYIAEDDCANRDTCQMMVTVVDDIAPLASCEENLEIGLTNAGTAQIFPNVINSNSIDNCAIDSFELSRDGLSFGPSISFDCNDIALSPIEVTLKVYDTSGNYSECNSQVQIVDNIYPVISCPADLTISCQDNYEDLNLTGIASATDNCSVDTIYFSDSLSLNTCNIGVIDRTWTTVDHAGNIQNCIQHITLEDNSLIDVQFPTEYTSYTCGALTDPSITGTPMIINGDCEDVGISHTDNVFNIAAPACYTILRNWVVVEWCTFDPNSGSNDGYWTYTQIIKVLDNDEPIIDCPDDVTIGINAMDCAGAYVSLNPATGIDCNPNLSITNDAPFADVANEDASGTYPLGVHIVNFEASDGCGNTSSCSVSITVRDETNPSVICVPGLIANLTQDGTVVITPEMLDYGSYDNCTAEEDLSFAVNPSVFTCDDIGVQNISLMVTDEAGNMAFCVTTIEIQNNGNNCPFININGAIKNEDGNGLAGVKMLLSGDEATNFTTDSLGYYAFNDLPSGGSFTLTPFKDTLPRNGVNTFDLIILTKHLLHIQDIDSPYKLIAADVDRSGHISIFDVIDLRKLLLFINIEFPNNTSWRFVKSNYIFPNPSNPFQDPFPESFTINNLYENLGSADFVGIKIGDIDNTANPYSLLGETAVRNETEPLTLQVEDQFLKQGEQYRVPVYASDFAKVLGCQFTLSYDPELLEIETIETGTIASLNKNNFGWQSNDTGALSFSWHKMQQQNIDENPILFYLSLKAKRPVWLREALTLNSELLRAEAYLGDANFELESLKAVVLQYENTEVHKAPVAFLQNTPNPFNTTTNITFELQKTTAISLKIYNAEGKLMKHQESWLEEGIHQIEVRAEDLNFTAGIYYYQLLTKEGSSATQKMLFLH